MFYLNLLCSFCLLSINDVQSKYIHKHSNALDEPIAAQAQAQVLEPQIDVKSAIDIQNHSRVKRYGIWHNGWNRRNLSYKVLNKPTFFWPKLKPDELSRHIEAMVERAFAEWAQYSGLRFVKSDDDADISISFQRGNHGDNSPFDGPDHILAHSAIDNYLLKSMKCTIHIDDDELWVDVGSGHPFPVYAELYPTLMHEIGHALGLDDSNDRHTIMTKIRSMDSPVTLQKDDILGILHIYGKLLFKSTYY